MKKRRILGIALLSIGGVILVGFGAVAFLYYQGVTFDPLKTAYDENCSACHGQDMEGTGQGSPLIGVAFRHGESVEEISASIANGFPAQGMPGWSGILPETEIRRLAIYIAERRSDLSWDFKVRKPLEIPGGVVRSTLQDFRIEAVAEGLDPLPYSIAPLPDGGFLLTEKMRGLKLVSADGVQSPLVEGTPSAHADPLRLPFVQLEYGTGWIMEVATHPDYAENGWIYLHFGDRCEDCNAVGGAVSMNKVVRGRIDDGRWVDEETIWSVPVEDYSPMPDMAAGGRLCFDAERRLYISVGMKGSANYYGIQDLSKPYGKIHRVHDDGGVPRRQSVRPGRGRAAHGMDLRPPQPPGVGMQSADGAGVEHRDGPPGRRRDQPAPAGAQLRLAASLQGGRLRRHPRGVWQGARHHVRSCGHRAAGGRSHPVPGGIELRILRRRRLPGLAQPDVGRHTPGDGTLPGGVRRRPARCPGDPDQGPSTDSRRRSGRRRASVPIAGARFWRPDRAAGTGGVGNAQIA